MWHCYAENMDQKTLESTLKALDCESHAQVLLCIPKGHVDRGSVYTDLHAAPLHRESLLRVRFEGYAGLDSQGNATGSPYPASIEVKLSFEVGSPITTRFFGLSLATAQALEGRWTTIEAMAVQMGTNRYLRGARLQKPTGRIDPLYNGIGGKVSGERVQEAIEAALGRPGLIEQAAEEVMASTVISRRLQVVGRSASALLYSLHRPASLVQAANALTFVKRCTIAEVRAAARRASMPSADASVATNIDKALIEAVGQQREVLSPDQRQALNTIRKAINVSGAARILLNGDVGSGKTLVFLLSLAAVVRSSDTSSRVAVMVPSDLVARQIHAQASSRFPDLRPALVCADSSDIPVNARMLIGTQALLARKDVGQLTALVVDEQHKFSVDQRSALVGPRTHVIEASATPIPRSLALALFSGWVQARIERCPVEKDIASHVLIEGSDRDTAVQLVQTHLQRGKRVIFLYPKVSGDNASVKARGQALSERFPGKVAIIHGKLSNKHKQLAISQFADGSCPIAVASTAVEVGMDVPDVGLMIVSGADRFGASQLHQLRGRLVRNGGSGDFVMMLDRQPARPTLQRLHAVRDHLDGFALAERDLQIRGFGDVLGDMQTGKSTGTFKLTKLSAEDFLDSPG